jgi:hypothetical protein
MTRARVITQKDIKPQYDFMKLSPYFKIWVEFSDPDQINRHITEALGPEVELLK